MSILSVGVTFHGPLRIGRGLAENGLDDVVDHRGLPASSLKGVMRAAGTHMLGLAEPDVERLFGSVRIPGAWAWEDLRWDQPNVTVRFTTRVRIAVDAATGSASHRGLQHAEEVWIRGTPAFMVEPTGPRSDRDQTDALLMGAAALAVHSLGASRRRGLGWVTLHPRLNGEAVDPAAAARAVLAVTGASS